MGRLIAVAALCAALVLSPGCQVDTSPRTVAAYEPGERARLRKAPARGQFLLYATGQGDPTGGPAERADAPLGRSLVVARHLARGERVGFLREPGGGVVAVAAGERFPLEAGPHAWVMEAEPGQHNARGTVGLIVAVVLVVGVVAAIIIADDFNDDWDWDGGSFTGFGSGF